MQNLDNNYNSPRFLLKYDAKSGIVEYDIDNIYPNPFKVDKNQYTLIILGTPILGNISNKAQVSSEILSTGRLDQKYVKLLDGEFLFILLNRKNNTIEIANDRFTSFPMYYYILDNVLTLSYSYLDIIKVASKEKKFKIRSDILFEFLWFRRVFNDNTYDSLTKFLKPARIISFSIKGFNECVYWRPCFTKSKNSLNHNTDELARLILLSLEKKTLDLAGRNAGLFLSGGMDTRTILAAFSNNKNIELPTCFTGGYSKLGEYRVAKKLTQMIGAKHHFIHVPETYNDTRWGEKLHITGGMYNQFGPIFSGHSDKISSYSDVFFHGHGLDYMFQGMYLPGKHVKILGNNTYYKKITNLNKIDNFSEYFSRNAPYRTWKVDVESHVLPEYRSRMIGGLVERMDMIAEEGRAVCNDNFDLWEYFMIHTPFRHYSQPDIISMATNGEQRKVANDNDLFDFYLSLPIDQRKYARIMRGALSKMSPSFAKIISANTGYKIDATPTELTAHFALYKAMRVITNDQSYSHPSAKDRTWADDDIEVRIRPRLNTAVSKLSRSEYLREYLPFLDFNALDKNMIHWLDNKHPGGGLFITSLLTIENLLKKIV